MKTEVPMTIVLSGETEARLKDEALRRGHGRRSTGGAIDPRGGCKAGREAPKNVPLCPDRGQPWYGLRLRRAFPFRHEPATEGVLTDHARDHELRQVVLASGLGADSGQPMPPEGLPTH